MNGQALSPPTAPPTKTNFRDFSREADDWDSWSRCYQTQLSAIACSDALTGEEENKVGQGRSNFNSDGVSPREVMQGQSGMDLSHDARQELVAQNRAYVRMFKPSVRSSRSTLPYQWPEATKTAHHRL